MPTYLYLQDSSNNVWQVGVNDSGNITTTQGSGTVSSPIIKDFQSGLTAWQIGIATNGSLTSTSVAMQGGLQNEIPLLSNPSNKLFGLLILANGMIQVTQLQAVTAGGLCTGVQSILNDAAGDYWNFNLLLPFLRLAYEDLSEKVNLNQFRIVRQETTILSIPAQTTVIGFGTFPSLPANLNNPIYLEERWTGQTAMDWTPMEEREFSVDDIPEDYLNFWWWDGYQLNFLGSTVNEDIKLIYSASLWHPESISDLIQPRDAGRFLKHRTAHYAADSIGDQYHATNEMNKSIQALEEFARRWVQTQQGLPVRRIGYRRRAKGFVGCFR